MLCTHNVIGSTPVISSRFVRLRIASVRRQGSDLTTAPSYTAFMYSVVISVLSVLLDTHLLLLPLLPVILRLISLDVAGMM